MDADIVEKQFTQFSVKYPKVTSDHMNFLNLLKNHISRYGSIEIEELYAPPFTTLHSDGLDGVFIDEQMVDALLAVIDTFRPQV